MPDGAGKTLYLLTGCTAVGKTELALDWAERNGAEIVSCDSLLFYRGMDIGTAKPTETELARVPHHLIDICELSDEMDVTRYVALARSALEAIRFRGRQVLVTGGSGFYLKAFFAPVADDIAPDPELRRRVDSLSLDEALLELRRLNPGGLGNLDTANPRRVLRALERCLATGKTLEVLLAEFSAKPSAFADWNLQLVELTRVPSILERRMTTRVEKMLAAGLVDEVRGLMKSGLEANRSAAKAIGYREVIAMLKGELPEKELLPSIVLNTKALVKKQRTWFRTQLPEHRTLDAAMADAGALFKP